MMTQKEKRNENLNLRLCFILKTTLSFEYHPWSTLNPQGLWHINKLSNLNIKFTQFFQASV